MTMTKSKPPAKRAKAAKRTEFGEKGEADLFVIHEHQLWDAADAWLKKRGVNPRAFGLYASLLVPDEEKSITWTEWQKRFQETNSHYAAAGWRFPVFPQSPWQFQKVIAGVSLGIEYDVDGVVLRPTRDGDEVFAEALSETGYFHMTSIEPEVYDPDVLERDIERLIAENRAKSAKAKKPKAQAPKPKSSTAITVAHEAAPAPLSAEEKKTLQHHEKTIGRSANAFLELGDALAAIQEKRLYRADFSTFEAYLWDRWKIEKSVAYRCIKAAESAANVSAIADKLNLRLTNEAQYRAIERLEAADQVEVLKRAARKVVADADGQKVPTAKVLSEAVREYTTSPDDLKRDKERRKDAARERADIAPAKTPASAAGAEDRTDADRKFSGTTLTFEGKSVAPPLGVNLDFPAAMGELRSYVAQLLDTFDIPALRCDLAMVLFDLHVVIKGGLVGDLKQAIVDRSAAKARRAK